MATGPAYMNAVTSHSKVKTTISLSAPLFVAGQDITGKVELECKAEREVGIGLIMIELLAMQELNSRDHTAATTFIHSRRVFQGPGLPPSNAVYNHTVPQDPSFPPSYFPGRKGITTFFFKFPTPISSPSSVSFASDLAKIEYKIRASIGVSYKGETRFLTNSVNAELVQCQDMDDTTDEHVVVGENGKVYVRGKLVGGRVIMGEKGCLELHVKNQTSKKTTGLTLTLTRSLHLHGAGASIPVQLTDTPFSESFRSAEYCVPPGIEGVANLVFDVPSAVRVVKGGIREDNVDSNGARKQIDPLFELRCYLSVKIGMGLGSKDILFEMPIQVKHRAVLGQDAAHDHNGYLSSVSPEPIFNRAISPIPPLSPRALSPLPNPHVNSTSPGPYAGQTPLLAHSPLPAYTHYNQPPLKPTGHPPVLTPGDQAYARAISPHLWSPTSPVPTSPHLSQSPLPAYYFPPPMVQLLPFAYPARPSSADPYYYPYYHQNQAGLPSGLPVPSANAPFFAPYLQPSFQYQSQTSLTPVINAPQPPVSLPPFPRSQAPPLAQTRTETQPEVPSTSSQVQSQADIEHSDQAAEGKGDRASRIAHHLHTSNRARSVSPTSHRFPVPSAATTKQLPPQKITLPPARLHATSPRHPPVLSPKPVVSPSRTYFGEPPGRIGNGTAKSDRVDLLEQMVDLPPGAEEKSVEEVLWDLEEAERRRPDNKNDIDQTCSEPPKHPVPIESIIPKKKLSLLDVFNTQLPISDDLKDNLSSSSAPDPHKDPIAAPISLLAPDTRNEGLDALERRLLQDVGTRKPQTIRATIFDLGIADEASKPDPSGQRDKMQKEDSPPPSPHTVRLHPRQFRESQISELALGYDGDSVGDHAGYKLSSSTVQKSVQNQEEKMSREIETKQFRKDVDTRDEAKGRVSEWLGGLPQFLSSSPTHTDTAPTTYLAEPKKAPPRKRSIDGMLGFFGIGKNKSKEDLRATSPVIHPSPVGLEVLEQPNVPKGLSKPKDKPAPKVMSQSIPTNPSPLLTKVPGQFEVSRGSSEPTGDPGIPSQLAPARTLQRRTPSPSRKPAPKYVGPPVEKSFSKAEVDLASKPKNVPPRRLSDVPPAPKPVFKPGQINGAAVKVGKVPIIQPNRPFPSQTPTPATKATEIQPSPQIKELKPPVKPIKPDILLDKLTEPPFKPSSSPQRDANSVEAAKFSPRPSPPVLHKLKLETKEKNVKSKGTLPPIPVSAKQRLALPVSDSEAKYDARSARGGRGGITTSVAAIWAARAEGNEEGGSVTPSPVASRDEVVRKPLALSPAESKASSTPKTSAPRMVIPDLSIPQVKESPQLSAKMSQDPTKGTSVPALVDRYHAKPQLSSVATLSQPVLNMKYKPPSLSMTLSGVSEPPSNNSGLPAKAGELPLGQARLKELIKKYQQVAS